MARPAKTYAIAPRDSPLAGDCIRRNRIIRGENNHAASGTPHLPDNTRNTVALANRLYGLVSHPVTALYLYCPTFAPFLGMRLNPCHFHPINE